RILIPKELVNAGNLQKEVYLIPLGTYYQIWDKDAYEQHLAGNKGVNLNDAYSDVISELGAINDTLNNK
ncbi:MAG: division/cell wall cluster transcriptional repressor MraZ, partial [Bacteroidales bacterium]|nr:division/cell wall cluster transcriptional repressor MraZ [Bacteroidales bacterium]